MKNKRWHTLKFVFAIFIFLTIKTIESKSLPCPKALTIDITKGRRHANDVLYYSGVYFPKEKYFSVRENGFLKHYGCICDFKLCFRKCCPIGEVFGSQGNCVNSNQSTTNFNVPVFNFTDEVEVSQNHFHLIVNKDCPQAAYQLNPTKYAEDLHFLQIDGTLYQNYSNTFHLPQHYCFEYFEEEQTILPLVCFTDIPDPESDEIYSTGMIISLPFLLATFMVYAVTPELRNLHGKCLMCYVFSLFIAYIFLVTLQINTEDHSPGYCKNAPFIVYFAFMVSFLWLNVMCIDIWWTFSGRRGFVGSIRQSENKRFMVYSAYAWGVALIFVIVTIIMQYADIPEYFIKPKFGDGRCWFRDDKSVLTYFYGPIMLILLINIILFSWTTYKIYSVKKETAKSMRHDSQRHGEDGGSDKQRFKLYLKLILVFGVNWSMEIISWYFVGPQWLWYITDMCNAMYGVFIFIIFVCKQNVWRLAKKRYYSLLGRPHMAHGSYPSSDQTKSTAFNQDSVAMT